MDAEGHQIASHTWTHLDLSAISSIDRKKQIWMNEMALRNILGKIPTYLRPPYSSCTSASGCQQDVADLGYHITNFNVDTDDYNRNKPEQIQMSKDWFKGNITKNGAKSVDHQWLSIGHDILEQTANNLTEYMLNTIKELGYKSVTVGECLGDPKENWYRKADGAGVSVDNNTAAAVSKIPAGALTPGWCRWNIIPFVPTRACIHADCNNRSTIQRAVLPQQVRKVSVRLNLLPWQLKRPLL